jgi:hypothetical protein
MIRGSPPSPGRRAVEPPAAKVALRKIRSVERVDLHFSALPGRVNELPIAQVNPHVRRKPGVCPEENEISRAEIARLHGSAEEEHLAGRSREENSRRVESRPDQGGAIDPSRRRSSKAVRDVQKSHGLFNDPAREGLLALDLTGPALIAER